MKRNIQALPIAEQLRNRRVAQLWANKTGSTKHDTSKVEQNEIRTKHMQDRADRNMALYSEERNFQDARKNYDKS